jgi:hypothetical protein
MSSPTPFFHFQQTLGEGPYATQIRGFGGVNPFATVWYVNSSTGSNGNTGTSPNLPFSTLAYALSVAAAGDTIVLAPGFAVTLTAVLTLTLARLTIIGIGIGTAKPTITVNAAVDGLSLEAANITIDNVHFAAPETDAATAMINVAAAGCRLFNISGIGSKTAKNFVSGITIASGADDLFIRDLEIYNSVVAMDNFISIEAAVARLKMRNVFCFGDVVTAGIIDGATATHLNWADVTIGILGTTLPAIILDNNPTGLIRDSNFSGTIATLTSVAQYGNALRLFNVKSLEETDASAQGALIPAVDVN